MRPAPAVLPAAAAALFLSASPCRSASVPVGPDYEIPTFLFLPLGPYLAGSPEDSYLIGWEEPFGAVMALAIRHDGTITGSAPVARPGHDTLDPIAVSAGASPGEFAFFWEVTFPPAIMGRRLDLQAQPLGQAFQVSSLPAENTRPAASSWAQAALVAWESGDSYGNDHDSTSIQIRGVSPDGKPLWPELQVNDHIAGGQSDPDLAVNPAGRIVVVWESETSPGTDADGLSIQARLLDAGLGAGPQFQVNTTEAGDQERPRVAIQEDGSFLVVWESATSPHGDPDGAVIGRAFDPEGSPFGGDFQINQTTAGSQDEPAVVSVGATYEVAWDDAEAIWRRCYDRKGIALTRESQVNTTVLDGSSRPALARGATGHVVAVWRNTDILEELGTTRWYGRSFAELLFTDGFESGDTSAWEESVP